jgi:hypothetical protein
MTGRTIRCMANIPLEDFIGTYREELIRRCLAKVASRVPPAGKADSSQYGVPRFLEQLCEQLRDGAQQSAAIGDSAKEHGHDLLMQGFSIEQVVHDYGDVCQSITDLAVELDAPISTDDFRTLNRCLDDAIAGAVTEFAREQSVTRAKQSAELHSLTEAAICAFRFIRAGGVGAGGSTGAVVERNLAAILAAMDAASPEPEQTRKALTPTPSSSSSS